MNAHGHYSKYIAKWIALLVLPFAGNVAADEKVYSGYSIGSTHIVGYDYEVVRDGLATQYSLGLFELAPSGSITWKRFHTRDGPRIYYGAGPWLVMAILPMKVAAARAVAGMIGTCLMTQNGE